jgi:hypothetical protein
VPGQGKVYFLGGEIRGRNSGANDFYNVRTREVVLTEGTEEDDWSTEE